MGILDCYKVIKRCAPKGVRKYELQDFKGKKAAIDTNAALYVYCAGNMDNPERAVMQGLGNFIFDICFANEITPVFVIDGIAPVEKAAEKQKRELKREQEKKDLLKCKEELTTLEKLVALDSVSPLKVVIEENSTELTFEQKQTGRQLIRRIESLEKRPVVTSDLIRLSIEFLKAVGVEVIQAISEGEATCAVLNRMNYVDVVFSDDADVLAFGAKVLARGAFSDTPHSLKKRELYDIPLILSEMGLSRESFVDFAILAGSDFNGTFKIPGIAALTASKLLRQFPTIEQIVEFLNNGGNPARPASAVPAVSSGKRNKRKNPTRDSITLCENFSPTPARNVFHYYLQCTNLKDVILSTHKYNKFNVSKVQEMFAECVTAPALVMNLISEWRHMCEKRKHVVFDANLAIQDNKQLAIDTMM